MRQATLKGELRYQKGKGAARRLRARHRVPAVIYGRDKDTTCISLDEREFEKALQTGLGGGTLIKLVLSKDGDEAGSDAFETVAILKEVQSDVVRGNAIHVDFQAVSMDEAITPRYLLLSWVKMPGQATEELSSTCCGNWNSVPYPLISLAGGSRYFRLGIGRLL